MYYIRKGVDEIYTSGSSRAFTSYMCTTIYLVRVHGLVCASALGYLPPNDIGEQTCAY